MTKTKQHDLEKKAATMGMTVNQMLEKQRNEAIAHFNMVKGMTAKEYAEYSRKLKNKSA